ncbi:MAG: ASCH domain-containing protein [Paraclostridium sp.]
MNAHTMGLNPDAMKLIKNGIKTIEMRLYDDRRKKILKGDYILFVSTLDEGNTLKVKVIEIHRYDSFNELYKNFNKIELGYSKNDIAHPRDMEKYYSKENIHKYGVVGIEVAVDKP